ncbi:MAG: hypothetical protein R3F61_21655 [Myxococcota bacterium]
MADEPQRPLDVLSPLESARTEVEDALLASAGSLVIPGAAWMCVAWLTLTGNPIGAGLAAMFALAGLLVTARSTLESAFHAWRGGRSRYRLQRNLGCIGFGTSGMALLADLVVLALYTFLL